MNHLTLWDYFPFFKPNLLLFYKGICIIFNKKFKIYKC